MKTALCQLFFCCQFFVLQANFDQYTYCECCLAAAQEIANVLKETSKATRPAVVENLISSKLCDQIFTHKHVSSDKMKSACRHLLALNHEQFKAALLNEDPKSLQMILCYEQSKACLGVKRQSFTDNKVSLTESDIDALIQDNKDIVRISQPVHSDLSRHTRDKM